MCNFQLLFWILNTVLKNSEILSRTLSPLLPLHVNIFQILFALLFVRGAFLLLQVIAQLLHDGVRQGGLGSTLSRACTSQHWVWTIRPFWPTELCGHRKMPSLFEFCVFFLLAFAGSSMHRKNDCHTVPNGKVQNARLFGLFVLAARRIFVELASLEVVTAPWSVQPNRHVEEETTQVGGGQGSTSTVCLCKRPHDGERVAGQLSHNALATAHAYNGTWPTSKKPLCVQKKNCAFAVPRGPLLQTVYCDFECASSLWEYCQSWEGKKTVFFSRRNSIETVMLSVPLDVLRQYFWIFANMGLLLVHNFLILRRATLRCSSTWPLACGSRGMSRTSLFLFVHLYSRTTGSLGKALCRAEERPRWQWPSARLLLAVWRRVAAEDSFSA